MTPTPTPDQSGFQHGEAAALAAPNPSARQAAPNADVKTTRASPPAARRDGRPGAVARLTPPRLRFPPAAQDLRARAADLPRSCGRTGRRRRFPRRRRAVRAGTTSASGSSTSTCRCSEWMKSSFRSSGASALSAISRRATTGFLSLSRSTRMRLTGRNQPGAMRREQHEIEAVFDLVDAIFDGDARHLPASSFFENEASCYYILGRQAMAANRTGVGRAIPAL